MKILVTGAAGQLGSDVMEELRGRGADAVGVDLAQMDIADGKAVARAFESERPEGVIHCAAWTNVEGAEDNEETCRRVNATGTANIARACASVGARMLYISTDYVFDGTGTRPWRPDDERGPVNVYGRTKFEGELAVEETLREYFIVRIAWLFGVNGKNFARTMLNLGKTHETISVVSDQIGTPTYSRDLARLLADMIETDAYGRYHATNEGGYISWYDFACEIFRQAARVDPVYGKVRVLPIPSSEYPAKVARPENSRLDKSRLAERGFESLPDWRDALRRYIAQTL